MNIGIVGLGYWGQKVYDEYQLLKETKDVTEVVAIDKDESKINRLSNPDVTYSSLEKALPRVDALHICTGNRSHYSLGKIGLEASKDVLIEKPLTMDVDDAFDLVEVASENGQLLKTGHIFRFANVIRQIKSEYCEGNVGELNHLQLQWTHHLSDTSTYENVLWDLLPHPVDILNFVTDEWPVDVSAESYPSVGSPEAAFVNLKYSSFIAHIHVSWVDYVRRRSFNLAGSEGSLKAECVSQNLTIQKNGNSETVQLSDNNTIKREATNFIDAIKTRENTHNSAIIGARTVRTINRIQSDLNT